jgi:hypothetical protein
MPRRGSTKRIPRVVTALTARTQLGQILRRVRQDKEKFVIEMIRAVLDTNVVVSALLNPVGPWHPF